METSTGISISKWWLKGIVVLLSASPPALLLWFQDSFTPYLSTIAPVVVLRLIAGLLLTTLALLAFLALQRPWLKWDEHTGTWINHIDGLRYCGTCRAKKLFMPLKNEASGWRCVACGIFRKDPARKTKEPAEPPAPSGPNAWMAR